MVARLAKALWVTLIAMAGFTVIVSPGGSPASASPRMSITVQPTSGPVGSPVTVSVHGGADCGAVIFESINGGGGWAVGVSASARSSQTVLIPSFVGTFRSIAVTHGVYRFSVSCFIAPGASEAFQTAVATFHVTVSPSAASRFVGMARTPDGRGYWLAQAGGGVYSFGDAPFHGSLPGIGTVPASPIVGIAATPDGGGYWLVGSDGGIFAFGDALFEGSLPGRSLAPALPIVGIVPNADGAGYWLMGADGVQFVFGTAPYCPERLWYHFAAPYFPPGFVDGQEAVVGVSANAGSFAMVGFSEVGSSTSGGSFPGLGGTCSGLASTAFGDTFGLDTAPEAQVAGLATSVAGRGPWLVGIDGGVFALPYSTSSGSQIPAPLFYGSLPSIGVLPAAPIASITATPDGGGYWLLGADGGVFAFGDAHFYGSAAG
jgi:hypothetical protein